jgi:hypothetical protein
MIVRATDEFIEKVRAMPEEQLRITYREYRAKYEALEQERLQCWDRFMAIQQEQDNMGGELQTLAFFAISTRRK